MRNLGLIAVLILIVHYASAQSISVYKIEDLEKRIQNRADTVLVLNFWATWCKPCVAEIPDFERLNAEMKNTKFKLLLVSMDFKEDLNKKLIPFVQKNNYQSEIILLDEIDGNHFIDKIEKQWTGAIPATLILFNQKRKFIGTKTNYEFLKQSVSEIQKPD